MRWLSTLRHVGSELAGRGRRNMTEPLLKAVRVATDAVAIARQAAIGEIDTSVARTKVGELESLADACRSELVTSLSRALVTPIDREDLYRLSRSIDDVMDNLRDFSRELDIFGNEVRSDLFSPVFGAIHAALVEFSRAVSELGRDLDLATNAALNAKKLGNLIRLEYQLAVGRLLDADIDRVTLKRRELLRRLDLVGLELGYAADALADGRLKRGA